MVKKKKKKPEALLRQRPKTLLEELRGDSTNDALKENANQTRHGNMHKGMWIQSNSVTLKMVSPTSQLETN